MPGRGGSKNALLGALPPAERASLEPCLEPVQLRLGEVLLEAGEPAERVWFPQAGVISCTLAMSDGLVSETVTIGREGMLGVEVVLGDRRSLTRALVQLEGAAWRLDARHLEAVLARSPTLRRLCLDHVRALLGQALQNAACNSLHQAEARLCRWLLLVHDRADGDELPLTHEFLAGMLGLARRSVTVAAQALQERGLVRYRPRLVTIVDRAGLEAAACECYAAIRAHYARLLSDPPG